MVVNMEKRVCIHWYVIFFLFLLSPMVRAQIPQTYTYEFTSKVWNNSGEADLGKIKWMLGIPGNFIIDYDAKKGHSFGFIFSGPKLLTLSTDQIPGIIKKIIITTSGGILLSPEIDLSTSVDGQSWGAPKRISLESAEYTFEGEGRGMILIQWNQTKQAPIYLKKIEIVYLKDVASPVFTPGGGSYSQGQEVKITQLDNDKVYYTLDGTEPSIQSSLYNRPIKLPKGTTQIRAVAYNNMQRSPIVNAVYYIGKVPSLTTTVRSLEFSELNIANQILSEKKELSVTAQNLTSSASVFLKNKTGIFEVTPTSINNGKYRLEVAFNPLAAQSYQDTLVISGGGLTVPIQIPLRGQATAKGSKIDPYNVGEAKIKANTQSDVWVKGYMIGSYDWRSFLNPITEEVASNIALANDKNKDALYLVAELSTGGIRDTLNILGNPDNVFQQVLVYGTLQDGKMMDVVGFEFIPQLPILSPIKENEVISPIPAYSLITMSTPTKFAGIRYRVGETGDFQEMVNPATVMIDQSCKMEAYAFFHDQISDTVEVNYEVLPTDNFILAVPSLDKWYAMSQDTLENGRMKAVEINMTKYNEAIISENGLVWKSVKSHASNPTKVSIQAQNGKYLISGETGLTLGIDPQDWQWDETDNLYKDDSGLGIVMKSLKGSNSFQLQELLPASTSSVRAASGMNRVKVAQASLNGNLQIHDVNLLLVSETMVSLDLRKVTLQNKDGIRKPNNPNCMIFASETLPLDTNVVINGICEKLVLTDHEPFDVLEPFKATSALYTRLAWQDNAWETIMLPYDVSEENMPYGYEFEALAEVKGYDLTFEKVTFLKAHVPYMMRWTGDFMDNRASCVFSVKGASIDEVYSGLDFTGVYKRTECAGKFILAIRDGVPFFGKGGPQSYVTPFHAYLNLEDSKSDVKYRILHRPQTPTSMNPVNEDAEWRIWKEADDIVIYSSQPNSVKVFGMDGRLVRTICLESGENKISGLSKGIYFIQNKKFIIY